MASFGSIKRTIFDKQSRKQQYQDHIRGLNAYERHKKFVDDYVGYYGKQKSTEGTLPVKTDQDTLREGYRQSPFLTLFDFIHLVSIRFIRTEEDDMNPSWEQRLVKRYYDKLFKEYCIADMSQYKTGKIGLRWRTEKEVNFSYFEAGENKQALVKLVACERCAKKLYYKKRKEEEQLKLKENDKRQKKRDRSENDEDTGSDYGRSKERNKELNQD
ncbi:protein FRA10AC1 [Striga asiatica]|uniref:Protein FRA10AC1 n=1 Tax=Striga asiatica TaxID=4170 RepID=A0A5A7PGY4_STRAF|nr:protein FRA10AC1 [Striga asiatica]